MRRGAANGADRISAILREFTPIAETVLQHPGLHPDDRAEVEAMLRNASQLQDWFVDHVHGDARPGLTPDLLHLSRAIDALEQDVALVCQAVVASQGSQ